MNKDSEFLQLCSGPDGALFKLTWNLVSFLALEIEDQRALIGPTEQWFVREGPHNVGANYFCGIVMLLMDHGGGGHFNIYAPDEVARMQNLTSDMVWNRSKLTWSSDVLENDERWLELRTLARAILEKARLAITPPKKPIWFPNEMEIWWRDYRHYDELAGRT